MGGGAFSLPPRLSPAGATNWATWDQLGCPFACLPDTPVQLQPSLKYIIIDII